MRFSALLVVTVLAAGAPPATAFADPPAQSGDTAQNATTDQDQIVCRRVAPPTGSRLGGGRECHSQREWDQRARDAQKELQENQMRGLTAGQPGGN